MIPIYNHNKAPLNEVTRWDILRRSQRESPVRFDKKKFYKAKDFNNVDFNELFENNNFTWSSRVGDYIVTLSFEGAFEILRWKVRSFNGTNRWKRITHRMLVECLSEALDRRDLYIDCSCPDFCLVEDTKIKLLNGEVVDMKELLNKFNNNEDIWVYSTDEQGDFKPGHVTDVWVSGYVTDLIEVTLDNGKTIITTPNHKYMLRTGEYLEASKLTKGQSLMPLYFSYHNGYESVKLNTEVKSFVSVYKQVADTLLQEQIEEAKIRSGESIISIHHMDFNKLNNYPSNLYPMGHQEHWKYHSDHVKDNPEQLQRFIQGGLAYWKTPEGRKQKSSEMHNTMRNYWDNMTEEERLAHNKHSHQWQQDENYRKKMSDFRKNYWANLDDETRVQRYTENAINLNGVNGEKASARIKKYWNSLSPEQYDWHCEQNRINGAKAIVTEKCIEARRENGKKRARQKLIDNGTKVIKYLLDNNIPFTEENYTKYREKGFPHYNTIKELGLVDQYNHKVKSIRTIHLDTPVPVYDLTVDKYNNFYVDAGVVLHNCYRFAYWATQAGCKHGVQQNTAPKVRNVKNNKGYCCKHILSVLYGKRWVPAAANKWLQFIKQNHELAEWFIWGQYSKTATDKRNKYVNSNKETDEEETNKELAYT